MTWWVSAIMSIVLAIASAIIMGVETAIASLFGTVLGLVFGLLICAVVINAIYKHSENMTSATLKICILYGFLGIIGFVIYMFITISGAIAMGNSMMAMFMGELLTFTYVSAGIMCVALLLVMLTYLYTLNGFVKYSRLE